LYNIPAKTRGISEASSVGTEVATSFGTAKYGGPCPPNGEHKYFFKLYALDTTLSLKNPRGKKDIEAAMKDHILTQAEMIGKYNRKK
jgi:Raf kinase inhibitor-like YbhB/YbcL family protein